MRVNFSMKVVNKAYRPYLMDYENRINVFYGGAASGKSHFVVQKLILKSMTYSKRRTLVIRKVGVSLRDSIFRLFKDILGEWGLLEHCRVNQSNLEIELPNGSIFLFKGLDDPEKIKSIAGIDDIIIEEATEIDLDGYTQLNLRLRSKNPHNQIHLMFNPVGKNNWVYKHWFDEDVPVRKGEFILHTTYHDNEHLTDDYKAALEAQRELNYNYYKVYVLGEFATLDKLVYTNVIVNDFNPYHLVKNNSKLLSVCGIDFGYSHDPTAWVALLLDENDKKIYVCDEFYERGMFNTDIAQKIEYKGYSKAVTYADSAAPKDIDELRSLGVRKITGAKKGPGSVLAGIQKIQQYQIIVNPKCYNALEEFKNFSWKKDKNGEYINESIDDYDHLMDALRYAVMGVTDDNRQIKIMDRRALGF